MAIRERLVYAIDVITDGANKGLKSFRTAVSDAEGATGKFKAGASSAMSTVQAHAGSLALAGGTALVAFGVKSVQAFTDGAIAAGKFSDASGLAVEDASRWQEVATDLGVSADAIAGGFVKLEKAIASNGPAVKSLGIEVVKTADGQADMNATMLDAIDRLGAIEDPAERAKAATELFGRGFADMAEIVLGDADDIKKRLEDVSDAQVFDADEVAKARKFRDAMDELQEVAQRLSITFGEALVPALTDIADATSDIEASFRKIPKAPWIVEKWWDTASPLAWQRHLVNVYDKVGSTVAGWFGAGGEATKAIEVFEASQSRGIDGAKRMEFQQDAVNRTVSEGNPAFSQYTDNLEANADAADEKAAADAKAAEAADRHREAVEAVAEAMEAQKDAALQLVGGDIAVRDAQRRAAEAAEELNTVLEDQETTLGDAGAAIDEAADAQLDAAAAAADYKAKQMEANGQTVDANTKALLLKQELQNLAGQLTGPLAAAIQNYIDQLGAIPASVGTTIVLNRPGRVGDLVGGIGGKGGLQRFASGGVVGGPRGQPQLAIVEGGETVLPTHKSGGGGIGGNYTINLYGGEATPQAVVDAIKRWERLNGTAWRS
jgi:hypothetical protein